MTKNNELKNIKNSTFYEYFIQGSLDQKLWIFKIFDDNSIHTLSKISQPIFVDFKNVLFKGLLTKSHGFLRKFYWRIPNQKLEISKISYQNILKEFQTKNRRFFSKRFIPEPLNWNSWSFNDNFVLVLSEKNLVF